MRFVYNARQFLLKWSFYSSLVMRDLTLRSANSFGMDLLLQYAAKSDFPIGSFHLMRLLYDEYIFYLVEQKIANVRSFDQL